MTAEHEGRAGAGRLLGVNRQVVQGGGDGEQLGDAGHGEGVLDAGLGADEDETTAGTGGPLLRFDEGGQSAGVHEGDGGEVDEEGRRGAALEAQEALAQFGGGVDGEFAGQ